MAGMPPSFDEREITVALSALLLLVGSLRFRRELQRVPEWPLLLAAIGFLLLGNLATVVEHCWAYTTFNLIEHFSYGAQSLVLGVWALRLRARSAVQVD